MPPLPNRQQASNPRVSRLAGLLWLSSIVAVLVLLAFNWQSISDWWRLRDYQPPVEVSSLADEVTMTPYARNLFYLNKPELLSSVNSFRDNCPENEDAIVLGCYHPGQNGIYIYNVKAADLQGVAQVTAAHEDLHAIYERLSDSERQRVDKMLQDYYDRGLTNQRVKDEIKLYKKTEPESILNEMHSTFGTEVAELPSALENHYKQYFSDRMAIVAFSQRYEKAFIDRQNKIRQDDKQLAAMKQQIDARQASLQAEQQQLNEIQAELQALLAAGQTSQYNDRIISYNGRVQSYNSAVAELKNLIAGYNQLVQARNAIAKELTTLDKALDTRLAPDRQLTN